MSHFIQLKIVRGVFKAKKGLTLFHTTELSFTKHSRAMVSSSTIELVLEPFFISPLKQHNIACI